MTLCKIAQRKRRYTWEFVIRSLTMYYISCVMHGQKDASDLIKTNESFIAWQHLAHFWESIRNGSILQNDSAHQLWHLTFANSCSIFFHLSTRFDPRKKIQLTFETGTSNSVRSVYNLSFSLWQVEVWFTMDWLVWIKWGYHFLFLFLSLSCLKMSVIEKEDAQESLFRLKYFMSFWKNLHVMTSLILRTAGRAQIWETPCGVCVCFM